MALFTFFKPKEQKGQTNSESSAAPTPSKRQTQRGKRELEEAARKAALAKRAEDLLTDHSLEWRK